MKWTLKYDLNGNRCFVSEIGNTTIVILLEPNLDKPLLWLANEINAMARRVDGGFDK